MAETPRYRLDFVVPERHDIAEDYGSPTPSASQPARNETLDRLRAALATDPRWERSMLAPWRPVRERQHLIVWIDLTRPGSEVVIRDAVAAIVEAVLPGAELMEMVKNPL